MTEKNNTVVVIDARERKLSCHVASMTLASEYKPDEVRRRKPHHPHKKAKLVLRWATPLGAISDLCCLRFDYPILIVGNYDARTSHGNVSLIGEYGEDVYWVGGCGYGYTKPHDPTIYGRGLRVFPMPERGILLPAGCNIETVPVFENQNCATAASAVDGLHLLAELDDEVLFIANGSSNELTAYKLSQAISNEHPEPNRQNPLLGITLEHRQDMFNTKALFMTYLRRAVGCKNSEIPAAALAYIRAANAVEKKWNDVIRLPNDLSQLVTKSEIEEIADGEVAGMDVAGWTFGIPKDGDYSSILAAGPNGEKDELPVACMMKTKIIEQVIMGESYNTPEEKDEFFRKATTAEWDSYFCGPWMYDKRNYQFKFVATFADGTTAEFQRGENFFFSKELEDKANLVSRLVVTALDGERVVDTRTLFRDECPQPDEVVTLQDAIDAGLCENGVKEWLSEKGLTPPVKVSRIREEIHCHGDYAMSAQKMIDFLAKQ